MSAREQPLSVVAIGAHPDDVEITCLGMLLLYRERYDARITIVSVSDGRAGGHALPGCSPDEVVAERRRESEAVADALGATYVCMGQRDQEVDDGPAHRLALTDVLRAAGADVLLAPPPLDYHADHMATSRLAFHASLAAKVAAIETEHAPLARAAALYYVEPPGGFDWDPTEFVDVTSVFERKCELLALHDSQMRSMAALSGFDLVHQVKLVNGNRGFQCGVPFAEAYATAPAWGRIRPRGLPGA